jgi:DNA-binding response OmpR family regulator
MTVPTVALIEACSATRAELRDGFAPAGVRVHEADCGLGGLRTVYSTRPDAIVMCVDLGDIDGFEALARIREMTDVPVMILSARDSQADKLRAFRCGADDYVTKPFDVDEVVLRTWALVRRGGSHKAVDRYLDAQLEVDFGSIEARGPRGRMELTPLQFRLLSAFVRHANQPLTPEQLLRLAWRDEVFSPERVKLHVSNLRRKLHEAGVDRRALETVRGFGYRYRPPA